MSHTKWQPTPKELVEGLEENGWAVELAPDGDTGGWTCRLHDGEVTVEASGVTQLSALWATILELIKLIPR